MIPAGSLIWPLVLKAVKWLFEVLFGWMSRKARETSPSPEPPVVPPPIITPPENTGTNVGGAAPQPQPVVVVENDKTSAVLASAAVQQVETTHAAQTAAAAASGAAIDQMTAGQLAENVNNVYPMPSTNQPKG